MHKHTMQLFRLTFLYVGLYLISGVPAFSQTYFPVPAQVEKRFVENLPHTVRALQAPATNKAFRILVYGQSISMQDWWITVKTFLEQTYPQTQIIMENRAIGGFSSDRLKHMADNDIVSFYPDLVLFHVYGNEPDYEQIIRTIRSRTTAEVLLQTDHIGIGQNEAWHDKHSFEWMPALCEKYKLGLVDIRAAWKSYLLQNKLSPAALLSDQVHLNEHGNYLMAEVIKNYFKALPPQAGSIPNVQTLEAGKAFKAGKRKIRVPFSGNRVDIVWKKDYRQQPPLSVKVDGKKPSAVSECYYFTRPSLNPDQYFFTHIGQLINLQLGEHLQPEEWKLTLTAVDTLNRRVSFRLQGARTGDDGEGSSDEVFTSRSGRIVLKPEHWFQRKNPGDFKQFQWVKPGDTLYFRVKSMCADQVQAGGSGRQYTLVQGIPSTDHVLEISGKALEAIKEISIYKPPLEIKAN